ncbi:hypothetical protein [Litorihabitans aurantiacus]|uniref:Uncharacterized protein n=1 Tax=Litorihabitans aurantiacus TaxID=1930061 RepID=A0AA37XD17_9MICO|nr:hypothetical protein [Litorihabitans aurantiacus]GMA30615.1 hypothetical protein GCM10025875_06070 [Litorihabitans aurantiacus]
MSAPATAVDTAPKDQQTFRVVSRVVLPLDADPDVMPLYVDFTLARGNVEAFSETPRSSCRPRRATSTRA